MKGQRSACVVLSGGILFLLAAILPTLAAAPARFLPLDSLQGLEFHNVTANVVAYKGRKAVRLMDRGALPRRIDAESVAAEDTLAIVRGTNFENGTIDVDVAEQLTPGAPAAARGFIGVAFHVNRDTSKFEYIYLRPLNARANDQLQRNHSAQYSAYPDFPWYLSRKEFPGQYESYVDLVPGQWTHVRIEVHGLKARLYVNHSSQPCLIVNDLKHGITSGAVALKIGPGTEGYFSNLKIVPSI